MRGLLLVWVSLNISWECLGRQVLLLNYAKIHGILLVWVSLDIAWECLRRQVSSLNSCKDTWYPIGVGLFGCPI